MLPNDLHVTVEHLSVLIPSADYYLSKSLSNNSTALTARSCSRVAILPENLDFARFGNLTLAHAAMKRATERKRLSYKLVFRRAHALPFPSKECIVDSIAALVRREMLHDRQRPLLRRKGLQ